MITRPLFPHHCHSIPKFTLGFTLASGKSTGDDKYIMPCKQPCNVAQSLPYLRLSVLCWAILSTMELCANPDHFTVHVFCLFQNAITLESYRLALLYIGFFHFSFLCVCSWLDNLLLSSARQRIFTHTTLYLCMHLLKDSCCSKVFASIK